MARITHTKKHRIATVSQIVALEKRVCAKLPASYKKFLRTQNGGKPAPNAFQLGGEVHIVECFFPVRSVPCSHFQNMTVDDLSDWPVQCAWEDLQKDLHGLYADCGLDNQGYRLDRLLPIGTDGCSNYLCLVLDGDEAGSVVFFDHETAGVTPLADSFSEFLAMLRQSRSQSAS